MLVYGLRANEISKLRFKNLEPERIKNQQKIWVVDRKSRFQNRPKTAIILNGKVLQSFDAWLETIERAGIKTTRETPVFLPFIYDRLNAWSLRGLSSLSLYLLWLSKISLISICRKPKLSGTAKL